MGSLRGGRVRFERVQEFEMGRKFLDGLGF